MEQVTVIGAAGFIGAALCQTLVRRGVRTTRVRRTDPLPSALGHVFYCAGLTADFRSRPHDTIEAHVCAINRLLRSSELESLTYLSSTRVYQRADSGREDAILSAAPADASDLYNLSKMAGEAICLADRREAVRVVRVANVYGEGDASDNFLASIVRAAATGTVEIGNGRDAAKDYIAIDDAVEAISRVPERASSRIINVASGTRTTNQEVGRLIERLLNATVTFGAGAAGPVFPDIDITRMRQELGVDPRPLEQGLMDWLQAYATIGG